MQFCVCLAILNFSYRRGKKYQCLIISPTRVIRHNRHILPSMIDKNVYPWRHIQLWWILILTEFVIGFQFFNKNNITACNTTCKNCHFFVEIDQNHKLSNIHQKIWSSPIKKGTYNDSLVTQWHLLSCQMTINQSMGVVDIPLWTDPKVQVCNQVVQKGEQIMKF